MNIATPLQAYRIFSELFYQETCLVKQQTAPSIPHWNSHQRLQPLQHLHLCIMDWRMPEFNTPMTKKEFPPMMLGMMTGWMRPIWRILPPHKQHPTSQIIYSHMYKAQKDIMFQCFEGDFMHYPSLGTVMVTYKIQWLNILEDINWKKAPYQSLKRL